MQNIRERLTGLWPVTGASSRCTARFEVSISASLTAGFKTSVDMGKRIFKKITDFPRAVPHFFQKLNMSATMNIFQNFLFSFQIICKSRIKLCFHNKSDQYS